MKMTKKRMLFFLALSGMYFHSASQGQPYLSVDTVASRIWDAQLAYQTLSARAKVTWSDDETETSFQTNIRMKKDSIVWMSMSSGGMEGVRLLIFPDSMCVLNKLAGGVTTHDLSYLQFWLPFPLSFNMLQEFIAGRRFTFGEQAMAVNDEDTLLLLHSESETKRQTLWVDKQEYTLRKIVLKDKLLQQEMEIIFDSYAPLPGSRFAHKRLITIRRGTALMNMTIDVSRVKLNEELLYPFERGSK